MINFIDVIDRAATGPMMTQKDFDVKVVQTKTNQAQYTDRMLVYIMDQ